MARVVNGKKKASTLDEWLRWQLRRLSYRWPPRSQAFAEARRNVDEFKRRPGVRKASVSARIKQFFECAICHKVFPRREVSADHVDPVVDPRRGWKGWDECLPRMFPELKGWQIICNDDHDEKTECERIIRTRYRREKNR